MPSDHRTVDRVDRILDLVARNRLTLSEIATALGAPISSTRDLLSGLEGHGYVRRNGARYEPGLRPLVLATIAARTAPLSHAELAELSAAARAPVLLAVLAGPDVYYLDHAGPRAPARLQDVVDGHLPRSALRTAAGRLLLALGRPDAATIGRLRAHDQAGWRDYEQALPRIRENRVARSEGLADPDIRAIAVPLASADDTALVVTGRRRSDADRSLALDAAARRLLRALTDS